MRVGRDMEREKERDAKRAEHERARLEKSNASAAKKAEARARAEQRAREAEDRMARRLRDSERGQVNAAVRKLGGIKWTGKADRGEVMALPAALRNQKRGKSLDTVREHLEEHFPWLALETTDDLWRYLDETRVQRMRRSVA